MSGRRCPLSLVIVLALALLFAAFLVKWPCVEDRPDAFGPLRHVCASDIALLYHVHGLDEGRVPYYDVQNEYPVGTGFFMFLAAALSKTPFAFLATNAALLGILALVTIALVHRIAGCKALYVALAPTLFAYAFVNWDLLAIVLATGATFAFVKGWDYSAGILIGLGAASKLYPALLIPVFLLQRWRDDERRRGVEMAAAAGVTFVFVNLPVALARPSNWSFFFRYNSERPVEFDSLWSLPCIPDAFHHLCARGSLVNVMSFAVFLLVSVALYRMKASRDPDFPRWTFVFPLLVVFLLSSKVYSPQYSLWLLPWFALALPHRSLFIAFQVTDVALFVMRFVWIGLGGLPADVRGVSYFGFRVAVVLRAIVLISCLAQYVRGRTDDPTDNNSTRRLAAHQEGSI